VTPYPDAPTLFTDTILKVLTLGVGGRRRCDDRDRLANPRTSWPVLTPEDRSFDGLLLLELSASVSVREPLVARLSDAVIPIRCLESDRHLLRRSPRQSPSGGVAVVSLLLLCMVAASAVFMGVGRTSPTAG
jgi:hypothetical protein